MKDDLKELKKMVNEANRKISKIEQRYGNDAGLGSWAVRGLYESLDNNVVQGISSFGKIQVNDSMTSSQLKAVKKATEKFLANKTSTLKGINEVKRDVKRGIQEKLANPDPKNPQSKRKVTDKDAELLYSFVENKTLRSTVEKIGASTVWNFLVDAKEAKEKNDAFGFADFMEDVERHIEVIPDQKMRKDFEKMYDKYFT